MFTTWPSERPNPFTVYREKQIFDLPLLPRKLLVKLIRKTLAIKAKKLSFFITNYARAIFGDIERKITKQIVPDVI